MKKGQKFFSRSFSRYVWFVRKYELTFGGVTKTIYQFKDICDIVIEMSEEQVKRDLISK